MAELKFKIAVDDDSDKAFEQLHKNLKNAEKIVKINAKNVFETDKKYKNINNSLMKYNQFLSKTVNKYKEVNNYNVVE